MRKKRLLGGEKGESKKEWRRIINQVRPKAGEYFPSSACFFFSFSLSYSSFFPSFSLSSLDDDIDKDPAGNDERDKGKGGTEKSESERKSERE